MVRHENNETEIQTEKPEAVPSQQRTLSVSQQYDQSTWKADRGLPAYCPKWFFLSRRALNPTGFQPTHTPLLRGWWIYNAKLPPGPITSGLLTQTEYSLEGWPQSS